MGISQGSARALTEQYFDSFNRGEFDQTARLFAQAGQILPPFEAATVGRENIARYLEKKAKNMVANPEQWTFYQEEPGQWQIEVKGKVQAIVFQVNVIWQFAVTCSGQIGSARITLVASPKELLSLRASKKETSSDKSLKALKEENVRSRTGSPAKSPAIAQ
ncbi:MAG: ketosteroid isomerase family protein [Phormidesmis sp.]